MTRHNVAPGMVLVIKKFKPLKSIQIFNLIFFCSNFKIYKGGKLVFCNHIFNGYGYDEKDFLKQLQSSKEDSILGKYLPYNFRFK
jgi:hypothetical protein